MPTVKPPVITKDSIVRTSQGTQYKRASQIPKAMHTRMNISTKVHEDHIVRRLLKARNAQTEPIDRTERPTPSTSEQQCPAPLRHEQPDLRAVGPLRRSGRQGLVRRYPTLAYKSVSTFLDIYAAIMI